MPTWAAACRHSRHQPVHLRQELLPTRPALLHIVFPLRKTRWPHARLPAPKTKYNCPITFDLFRPSLTNTLEEDRGL